MGKRALKVFFLHACRLARSLIGSPESADAVGKLFFAPDAFGRYIWFTGTFYWTTFGDILGGYIGFPFGELFWNTTFAAMFFTSGLFIIIAAGVS